MRSFPRPGDPSYAPGNLLDAVLKKLNLKNDAALACALMVAPPVISKIRHHTLPIGATLLLAIHELSGIAFSELRALMKAPRRTPRRIYVTPETAAAKLQKLRDIAESRGGQCLANTYIYTHAHLAFSCPRHGVFKAQPSDILLGQWCRECAHDKSRGDAPQRLAEYIRTRDGIQLSPYINARTHVVIRCKQHGEWQALPDNLVNKGSWCKRCASARPRPGRRRAMAELPHGDSGK